MIFTDGKNNNDDGRFTNRVYMERTTTNNEDTKEQEVMAKKNKVKNLRRNSVALHTEHKWVLGMRWIALPKLRRDSVPRNAYEVQVIKARRRIKGCGL